MFTLDPPWKCGPFQVALDGRALARAQFTGGLVLVTGSADRLQAVHVPEPLGRLGHGLDVVEFGSSHGVATFKARTA